MRALLVAAALAMSAPVAAAQEPPPLMRATAVKPAVGKPDARVAYGRAPSQFAELWLPKGAGPHPVIALIHGGCWQAKIADLHLMDGAAEDLARRGYAVWNIEYRRIGEPGGGYPGTYLDVGAALDALREQAGPRRLNLSRLVAVGHSAGGHLALWASARSVLPAKSPLRRPDPLPIPSVLSLGGVGVLDEARTDPVFSAACGATTVESLISGGADFYADTSPHRLPATGVRQIMLHGAREQIAPMRLGESYAAALRPAGGRVELRTVPNAGHFEVISPSAPAWTDVVAAIDELAGQEP